MDKLSFNLFSDIVVAWLCLKMQQIIEKFRSET